MFEEGKYKYRVPGISINNTSSAASFKALLKSKGVLTPSSVVSSEATKEGKIVKIVIEGELP